LLLISHKPIGDTLGFVHAVDTVSASPNLHYLTMINGRYDF